MTRHRRKASPARPRLQTIAADSPAASSHRAELAWLVVTLAIVLVVLLHASLFSVFTGRGLVPADGVLQALPWAKSFEGPPSNYLLADQYAAFLPVKQFFTDELRQGRFPLWNPHLASGIPSLASMQVAALYPLHLLLAPLGPFHSSGLSAFLKLLVAGISTLLYLRRLGLTPPAALLGGFVYSLSGFMVVWLGHPHVNAAILLPLLLYFIEKQFAAPLRLAPWIGFAFAYAAMLLGGHPPTAFHITVVVSVYFGFRLGERGRHARLRRILCLLAAMAVGAAMAAPQILPYLEYYRLSSSALATSALDRWASHLTPVTLAYFLLPYLSGAPHLGFEELAKSLGLGAIDNFNERTGYVGVFTWFLVGVAIVKARGRVVLFYAALAVVSLLIVYGVPPFPELMRALPVANGINHQRLLLMVGFSAAVLAAIGLNALLRPNPGIRPRMLSIAFMGTIAIALALVWSLIGPSFLRLEDASRTFLMRQLWVPVMGTVAAYLVTLRTWRARTVATIALGCVAVDLLQFGMGYNPAIAADRYYPVTEAIRTLQREGSHSRVLGLSAVLVPNTAAVYGLEDVRGIDFTTLRRYEELITGHAGDFFFYQSTDRVPASFPLLNVKHVLVPERFAAVPDGFELIYDGEIAIYRYTRAAARALVVFHHEVERSPAAVLARVRSGNFDPSKTVLLEEDPAPVAESADPLVASGEARIVAYEPDRVVIEVRLPRPGFLLLLDNHYPGWRAFAGDQEVPIHRANYTFRAVPLPAGVRTIEFVYRPLSFRIGVLISLMTIGLLLIVLRTTSRKPTGAAPL